MDVTDVSVGEPDDFSELKQCVFVGGNFLPLDVDGAVLLFLLEFDKVGDFLQSAIESESNVGAE